jgi:hypothetical protein
MLTLAGLGVASLAAWLAPLGWPFELFVHFRPQYGVAAVLLAIVSGPSRLSGLRSSPAWFWRRPSGAGIGMPVLVHGCHGEP